MNININAPFRYNYTHTLSVTPVHDVITVPLLTLGRRVTVVNPRPEGYGSRFVVLSIYLSTALQRAALTSSRQLRYEQAKHVDGLQSDGWILLKCFRSRVMAGSP